MPGNACVVPSCKQNYYCAKKRGHKCSFFRFPRDESLRQKWIAFCNRPDLYNLEEARVCSLHFGSDDFERDVKAELLNLPYIPKLKQHAIPSIHYTLETDDSEEHVNALKSVENIDTSNILVKENKALRDELENVKLNFKLEHQKCSQLSKKVEELEKVVQNLQKQKTLFDKKVIKTEVESEVLKILGTLFSKNQIDLILKRKSRAVWTSDEMSNAFTIRYFNKRCYVYLRQILKYPLPSLSTLQKWASNVQMRNGLLHDVLRIMQISGTTMTGFEKVVVLSFDEVKVATLYEYDQKDDEVVGPHSYMQVVMARGLFGKWKQPVYSDFDKKMSRDILNTIIINLQNIDYEVIACVCDCGGSNLGLWKELNISLEKTYFTNPVTKNNIYCFADAPHLLKLLRNWFLDTGFILRDGTIINKTPVECLIKDNSVEISSCYHLSYKHVVVEKTARQNVRLAAELLSHTTATALKHYLPGPDKQLAKDLGEFIDLCNSWFDIMNSFTPQPSVDSKLPYGKNILEQNRILNEMEDMVNSMRCIRKNTLQVFQKGILISISSLKLLYNDLKDRFGDKYILTHRLNQDVLENFFSQFPTRGGLHDHPSPLNALYRIRMILLGKNPGISQSHTNTVDLDHDEFIMTTMLKKSEIGTSKIKTRLPDNFADVSDELSESSTTSNSTTPSANIHVYERDGIQYIAGYIAKKCKEQFPELGSYTHEKSTVHSYAIPSWLQHLSYGGLTEPSVQWLAQVEKMEKYFKRFHKPLARKGRNIVTRTTKYIHIHSPEIPKILIRAYAKQRIFMRIKYLNISKRSTLLGKRRIDEQRQRISKYRKIVV